MDKGGKDRLRHGGPDSVTNLVHELLYLHFAFKRAVCCFLVHDSIGFGIALGAVAMWVRLSTELLLRPFPVFSAIGVTSCGVGVIANTEVIFQCCLKNTGKIDLLPFR